MRRFAGHTRRAGPGVHVTAVSRSLRDWGWHWKSHSQVYVRESSHTLADGLTRNSKAHVDNSTHAVLQTTGDWAVWSVHMAALFFFILISTLTVFPDFTNQPSERIIGGDGVIFRLVLCQRHTLQCDAVAELYWGSRAKAMLLLSWHNDISENLLTVHYYAYLLNNNNSGNNY